MATVMYDSASFVDISQIQKKIANSTQTSVIGVRESNAEVLSLNVRPGRANRSFMVFGCFFGAGIRLRY